MNVKLIALLLCLAGPVFAQGFAGLGGGGDGFAIPQRGQALSFPRDHGAHPEFRIEWWYLTANLQGPDGTDYGVQWTLFRSSLAPEAGQGWSAPQLWMGHAALTTPSQHLFDERLARGGVGQAGVTAAPFAAFIDEWSLQGADLSDLQLHAAGTGFAYDLQLRAQGPLVLHGDRGYSDKSQQGQASYYYSQPSYDVNGVLDVEGQAVPVTGQAWLDREWSSQPLAADQSGWDWFSLHFDSGARLMAFRLRGDDLFHSGSWIAPDGTVTPLQNADLKLIPLQDGAPPTRWRLQLPRFDLDISAEALNPQAHMRTLFPYWEGPVRVTGTHRGRGYLEMTGY